MGLIDNETQADSSMVAWLDHVQLSDRDREMAKSYSRKCEAVLDLIWRASARIRAVSARGFAICIPAGTPLSGQKPGLD